MTDPIIPPATIAITNGWHTTGGENVNYVDSELRSFREADLKAAMRGSWSVESQIPDDVLERIATYGKTQE